MRRQQLFSWTAGIALGLGGAAPSFAHHEDRAPDWRVDDRDYTHDAYPDHGRYRDRDGDRDRRDEGDRGRRGHRGWREYRESGVDAREYQQYTREGSRRGEIRRIYVTVDDLRRYQRAFADQPGWRTQGVTYGLVGPLTRDPELTFLDDAVLVGSYQGGGERIYVYLFDLRGEEHELQVAADGTVVDDSIL